VPIADVLLVSDSPLRLFPAERTLNPPLSKAMEVAPGIQLAGIAPDIVAWVMSNTSFRGSGSRRNSAMYGLVRSEPPGTRWDEDKAIAGTLFLSHLVRPTEAGLEFTARIETDEKGRLRCIEPSDVSPAYANAYCPVGARRRWLTQDDAEDLRVLAAAYSTVRPTLTATRLGAAVSSFFDVPFLRQAKPRALLVTASLEGLVCTKSQRATKQFTVRIPALANEVGLHTLDTEWAGRMYKLRSKLAHGSPLFLSSDPGEKQATQDAFNDALLELEELLRRILRTALLDPTFRNRLENVDTNWPVAGQGCLTCRAQDSALQVVKCPSCGRALIEKRAHGP
jgi:hypothetical protein